MEMDALADRPFHGHSETNRKCPRWAEFNSPNAPPPLTPAAGSPPGALSPFAAGPSHGFGGYSKAPDDILTPSLSSSLRASGAFAPPAPSPLATSPPMMAMDDPDDAPSSAAPKLKLTLSKRGQ